MRDFAKHMREIADAIFPDLAPRHGIDAAKIKAVEEKLGLTLPGSLVDFYLLAGMHEAMSNGMNHIFRPGTLHVEAGMLVFCTENQQCFDAGVRTIELSQDDPPVYEQNAGDSEWYLASKRLSDYLLVTFCWQACNTSKCYSETTATQTQIEHIRKAMNTAVFGVDPKNDTVGFWDKDIVGLLFTESRSAYFAAHSDERIEAFCSKLKLEYSVE